MLSSTFVLTTTILSAAVWIAGEASSPLSVQTRQRVRPACVKFYKEELIRVCTAPDEKWPCFNGSKLDNGKIDHLFKVDVFASSCCSAACSDQEIREYFCCHTEECLYKCYGKSTPVADNRRSQKQREVVMERVRLWQKFYPGSRPPASLFEDTQ